MLSALPYYSEGQIGRLKPIAGPIEKRAALELLIIVLSGFMAACAVAFLALEIRAPGHFVIKAMFPMVLGFAFVPRRMVGTLMGIAAGATIFGFWKFEVGHLQPQAVAALLALGPAIDIAMLGKPVVGWKLYLRCGLAGFLANMAAFGFKWVQLQLPSEAGRHTIKQLGLVHFSSFALCGIIAGIVGAVICFRYSVKSNEN